MESLSIKLNSIVEGFIKKYVPKETIEEFKIATIHFNVNLNACSKYDLMRIDHKAKILAKEEENKLLSSASIFSYIMYREMNHGQLSKEEEIKVSKALIEIREIITDYLTYRIDENKLNLNLFTTLTELGI
ncbi:MAG: hypothetical protein ACRC7N_15725 [Clostridium sp.]